MTTPTTAFHPSADLFQSLVAEEAETIIAGESLLYWVSYSIGALCYTIAHSSGTQTPGQRICNAALS